MVAEPIQMPLPNRPNAGAPESPPDSLAKAPADQTTKTARVVSSIEFPYSDLESALQVVNTINAKAGTECDFDQLAAWMGTTVTSGTFKQRVSAARMFGLARREGNRVRLTPLGRDTIDPSRSRNARVEAFLTVELYRAIYEKYRGSVLPPAAGLEAEMASLGVSPNQKDRARWAFEKSADYAGFFESGRDRLVSPSVRNAAQQEAPTEERVDRVEAQQAPRSATSQRDPTKASDHAFIIGLLGSLPAPETLWAVEGRAKWLQAASHIFDLMYKGEGKISIAVGSDDRPLRSGQDE